MPQELVQVAEAARFEKQTTKRWGAELWCCYCCFPGLLKAGLCLEAATLPGISASSFHRSSACWPGMHIHQWHIWIY
jgi:hypothetical protein